MRGKRKIVSWISKREEISKSKLRFSLDHIFGRGTSKNLDFSDLNFEYSRRTGRIRSVKQKSAKNLLFTFRSNGSIAPSIFGARKLLGKLRPLSRKYSRPRWTVTVANGVSDFPSQGRTVFCKHVVNCDDSLRAGEDVAILSEKGELLAVGRAIIAGPVMKQFKRGAAVKVREGVSKIAPAVV